MAHDIDIGEAAAFIEGITGEPDGMLVPMTWLTFSEAPGCRWQYPRIVHGTLGDRAGALRLMNRAGQGVFVMVNRGDGRGACAENVVGIRAHFVDADAPLTTPLALPASVSVETPRGFHHYWRTTDGCCKRFPDVQRRLALYYGTDPSVCDPPRKMRVPGFAHMKRGAAPVRLVGRQDAVYAEAELETAHPVVMPVVPIYSAPSFADGNMRAFERWASCKDVSPGNRHRNALKIASAGMQRGLPWAAVESVVLEYCLRAEAAGEPQDGGIRFNARQECRSIMRSVVRRHRA